MDKFEFIATTLTTLVNNQNSLTEAGVDKKVIKETITAIADAVKSCANEVITATGGQAKLNFQVEPAKKETNKTLATNKQTNSGTEDTTDETNKVESKVTVSGTESAMVGSTAASIDGVVEKIVVKEEPIVNAETNIKPAEPVKLDNGKKDTIDDPHASSRLSLEDAHDYIKAYIYERIEKNDAKMNDGKERDHIMSVISEVVPADDPCSSTNKDFKTAKKARIGLLDEIWKEVNKERKEKAETEAKEKEEKQAAVVIDTISEVEALLNDEKPIVEPTKLPENTKIITAEEVATGKITETKVVDMKNTTSEVNLATCTLAEFKKELERDYQGITDEAEYDENSERVKGWRERVNSRKDMADSVNIIDTEKKPKNAINFLKSLLGNIKKENQKLAKKSA